MITPELVKKINALRHKQKTIGLTESEQEEQREAREQYLAGIRSQVRGMLEDLKQPDTEDNGHSHNCSCKTCKH